MRITMTGPLLNRRRSWSSAISTCLRVSMSINVPLRRVGELSGLRSTTTARAITQRGWRSRATIRYSASNIGVLPRMCASSCAHMPA